VPSRGRTVLAALVLGVVASVAAYSAVNSTEQKVFKNQKLTSVYVVDGTVPRDESAATAYAQGHITPTRMPVRYAPVGAVTDLDAIADRVAGSTLGTGEVVVHGMFVAARTDPGQAADALPPGDVAVTVSVDPAAGVAGLIQPGDKVDILVDATGGEDYLYQSVPVLAVDTRLVPTPDTTPGSAPTSAAGLSATLVTFAMAPAAAAHIPPTDSDGSAFTRGVYLALQGPGAQPASVTAIDGADLIPGLDLNLGHGAGAGASSTTSTGSGPSSGSSPDRSSSSSSSSSSSGSSSTGSGTTTAPIDATGPNRVQGNVDTP